MKDKLIVNGVAKPLDGVYECDVAAMLGVGNPDTLTNGELHTIKRISGVRAGQLEDAIAEGDSDLMVALAVIVLGRNGKRVIDEQVLWDAPGGSSIVFEIGQDDEAEKEAESGPPAVTPDADSSSSGSGATSSPPSGPNPDSAPSPTGVPSSATPSPAPASDPVTSPA